MKLNKDYWNQRYHDKQMGWDIGAPSTPLKTFIDTLEDKNQRILIPGCGNAYEAEYLHKQGFTQVFVIDIAPLALEGFMKRFPWFPKHHLILGDFFEHNAEYDLILEQTFFCALDPNLRPKYVKQMHQLLAKEGELAGVLFNFELTKEGPPFGGSEKEYRQLFKEQFTILKLEPCVNSIEPRLGSEWWLHLQKK